jgi:hypothetical protein
MKNFYKRINIIVLLLVLLSFIFFFLEPSNIIFAHPNIDILAMKPILCGELTFFTDIKTNAQRIGLIPCGSSIPYIFQQHPAELFRYYQFSDAVIGSGNKISTDKYGCLDTYIITFKNYISINSCNECGVASKATSTPTHSNTPAHTKKLPNTLRSSYTQSIIPTMPQETTLSPSLTLTPTPTNTVGFYCAGFGRCDETPITYPTDIFNSEELDNCIAALQKIMLDVAPSTEFFVAATKLLNISIKCQGDNICNFKEGFLMGVKTMIKELPPGKLMIFFANIISNEKDLRDCKYLGDFFWKFLLFSQQWYSEQNRINAYSLHSPAVIIISDEHGRKTGFLEDGKILNEIPESHAIISDHNKVILISSNNVSDVKILGTAEGNITMDVIQSAGKKVQEYYFSDIPVKDTSIFNLDSQNCELNDGEGEVFYPDEINEFDEQEELIDSPDSENINSNFLLTIKNRIKIDLINYPILLGMGAFFIFGIFGWWFISAVIYFLQKLL